MIYVPRFYRKDDDTVEDIKLGVQWKMCTEGQLSIDVHRNISTLQVNETSCSIDGDLFKVKDLRLVGNKRMWKPFAGYSDWRLPLVEELTSLLDYKLCSPCTDEVIFPSTQPYWYATSSIPFCSKHSIWVVDFSDGRVKYKCRGSCFVRLVRNVT